MLIEMFASRARCIPLNHLLSLTCGVKECPKFNKNASNTNSTTFQERPSVNSDANSSILTKETNCSEEEVHLEDVKMFYDFSNKRKMECERYQDCSWFQQDLLKEWPKGKLSPAETPEPIIDIDEFDLAMQYATDHSISKGNNYLMGFDDVFLASCNKTQENSPKTPTDDDNGFDSKKLNGENACDGMNQLYGLRKTDSIDDMDYISSTNPAEIIPISLMERINSGNCDLTCLSSVKSEIKREEELCSPDSTSQTFMSTEDSDLIVGREEIVEENEAAEETCKVGSLDSQTNQIQDPYSLGSNVDEMKTCDTRSSSGLIEKGSSPLSTIKTEKLDFNLYLPKVNFEQTIGISTPDLDFMDLVDFINEDIQTCKNNNLPNEKENTTSSSNDCTSTTNRESENVETAPKNGEVVGPESTTIILKSNTTPLKEQENSKEAIDETTSIAERIKTKAKRRVTKKYLEDNKSSSENEGDDDDDDFELNDEDADNDDDDDYDYEAGAGASKRRCTVANRRPKNSPEVTTSGSRGQSELSPEKIVDSYRERRDKNNEASRRSRQNRKDRERHMFKTLEEEEKRNVKLRTEADVLEKQVTSLRKLLLQVVLRKADGT